MIFTQYIRQLQRLDEIETELYMTNPNPPICFTNKDTEFLTKLQEHQRHIVLCMAKSLGIKPTPTAEGEKEKV